MRPREFYTNLFDDIRKAHNITCKPKHGRGRAYIEERIVRVPQMTNLHNFLVGLHEVAHIVQGRIAPRYIEEYKATMWAIDHARSLGLTIPQAEINQWRLNISYAISKACRRGLKKIDPQVLNWVEGK